MTNSTNCRHFNLIFGQSETTTATPTHKTKVALCAQFL